MTSSTMARLVPGAALHIEPHVRLGLPAGPCAPGTCPCPVQPSSAQLRSCHRQRGPKPHRDGKAVPCTAAAAAKELQSAGKPRKTALWIKGRCKIYSVKY